MSTVRSDAETNLIKQIRPYIMRILKRYGDPVRF